IASCTANRTRDTEGRSSSGTEVDGSYIATAHGHVLADRSEGESGLAGSNSIGTVTHAGEAVVSGRIGGRCGAGGAAQCQCGRVTSAAADRSRNRESRRGGTSGWQDFDNLQIVSISGGRSIVDGHRSAAQCGNGILPLHPVGIVI